jgi:hypothetical protein
MECPHCNKSIAWKPNNIAGWSDEIDNDDDDDDDEYNNFYTLFSEECPACHKQIIVLNIRFCRLEYNDNGHSDYVKYEESKEILYPKYKQIKGVNDEVPKNYKKEFIEAYLVAQVSPKASAALSRRLLQQILQEEFNIKSTINLSKQIEVFINLPNIPPLLSQAIDAIRNIGNFAAHPTKSETTGEIADVENGEAEWLLEILEYLFDFTFVQPKLLEERKKKLNQKLQDLGKLPMKPNLS